MDADTARALAETGFKDDYELCHTYVPEGTACANAAHGYYLCVRADEVNASLDRWLKIPAHTTEEEKACGSLYFFLAAVPNVCRRHVRYHMPNYIARKLLLMLYNVFEARGHPDFYSYFNEILEYVLRATREPDAEVTRLFFELCIAIFAELPMELCEEEILSVRDMLLEYDMGLSAEQWTRLADKFDPRRGIVYGRIHASLARRA